MNDPNDPNGSKKTTDIFEIIYRTVANQNKSVDDGFTSTSYLE